MENEEFGASVFLIWKLKSIEIPNPNKKNPLFPATDLKLELGVSNVYNYAANLISVLKV